MTPVDYKDLYLKYPQHPRYNDERIVEDDIIEVVEQKVEMILFTNKGDLYGEPGLGCDLDYYLWRTRVGVPQIRKKIVDQIDEYVPELNSIGYTLDLRVFEGTIRDILIIDLKIRGYNLNYVFN